MKSQHYVTGLGKAAVYARIAVHVACRYVLRPGLFRWSPLAYLRFLCRAWPLLLVFRHNKVVRVRTGWKLHLYLPAYPTPAFFYALETKLLWHPPGPTTVVFSMTKACTYRCVHCYQRKDAGADLDEPLLLATARAVQDAGVALFDIEGGEPFCRSARLLKLVQALDSRSEVWVNTTGAGLTPEMLAQLKDAGLFGLMVSIHSPDPAVHDALTLVPGSFAVACDAIRLCRQQQLAAAVNSVLSEAELRDGGLARLMDLARELDCDYVQLIHPKPAGLWLGRREGMQTDTELIRRVQAEHVCYNSRRRHDYPSLAAQVFEESAGVLGCTAGGVDRFYVNAAGEVQPCEFLNLSFGNVTTEPFAAIFARMRSYFPTPGTDWLCCTAAGRIDEVYRQTGVDRTPLPCEQTQELVSRLERGQPTPLYAKLGIYR